HVDVAADVAVRDVIAGPEDQHRGCQPESGYDPTTHSSASTWAPPRRPLRATDFATGSAGTVAGTAPARPERSASPAKNRSPSSSSAATSGCAEPRRRRGEPPWRPREDQASGLRRPWGPILPGPWVGSR